MRYTRAQIVDGTGFPAEQEFETVEDYNGWSNRETWAVALHINNDQGWQESVLDTLRAALEREAEKESDDYTMPAWRAGMIICSQVESVLDELRSGYGDSYEHAFMVIEDIGSLWRVNWDEIGAAFLSDVAEEQS